MWAIWWLVAVALLDVVVVLFTAHKDRKPIKSTPGIAVFRVLYVLVMYAFPAVMTLLYLTR